MAKPRISDSTRFRLTFEDRLLKSKFRPTEEQRKSYTLLVREIHRLDTQRRLVEHLHFTIDNHSGEISFTPLGKDFIEKSYSYRVFRRCLEEYTQKDRVPDQKIAKRMIRRFCTRRIFELLYNYACDEADEWDDNHHLRTTTSFRHWVFQLWFGNTGMFAHVFCGEESEDGDAIGMHSLMQYVSLKEKGQLNVLGKPQVYRNSETGIPVYCKLRFDLLQSGQRLRKPVSTVLLRLSPICELALFTLPFLRKRSWLDREELSFNLCGCEIGLKCRYRDGQPSSVWPVGKGDR